MLWLFANLDACVRKGFAIRILKREALAKKILEVVGKIIKDSKGKEEVNKFKNELEKWDGPANAAKFLFEKFGK